MNMHTDNIIYKIIAQTPYVPFCMCTQCLLGTRTLPLTYIQSMGTANLSPGWGKQHGQRFKPLYKSFIQHEPTTSGLSDCA